MANGMLFGSLCLYAVVTMAILFYIVRSEYRLMMRRRQTGEGNACRSTRFGREGLDAQRLSKALQEWAVAEEPVHKPAEDEEPRQRGAA
jgi:hypothetical protein